MKCAIIILVLASCALSDVANAQNTDCGKGCMANGAQCVTATTYIACIPATGEIFDGVQTCKDGKICSDSRTVCVPANTTNVNFVCGTDASSGGSGGTCNQCGADAILTCVDETHFTLCNNRETYVQCTDAANGEVCSTEILALTGKICIKKDALTAIDLKPSCSNTVTTPTTVAPATPSVNEALAACEAKPITTATYYFIANPDDASCKTYIYCDMTGRPVAQTMHCPSGKLYDNAAQKCVTSTEPLVGCDSTPTVAPPSG